MPLKIKNISKVCVFLRLSISQTFINGKYGRGRLQLKIFEAQIS